MNENKEFDLILEYMKDYIDHMKPVSMEFQIKFWSKNGYIPYGRSNKNKLPFEVWKKLYIL